GRHLFTDWHCAVFCGAAGALAWNFFRFCSRLSADQYHEPHCILQANEETLLGYHAGIIISDRLAFNYRESSAYIHYHWYFAFCSDVRNLCGKKSGGIYSGPAGPEPGRAFRNLSAAGRRIEIIQQG